MSRTTFSQRNLPDLARGADLIRARRGGALSHCRRPNWMLYRRSFRESMAQLESGYKAALTTKTALIESQGETLHGMQSREDSLYDKLTSLRDEVEGLETQNEKLRRRIEAMENAKREASDHWDLEQNHLREEVQRARQAESRAVTDTSRSRGRSSFTIYEPRRRIVHRNIQRRSGHSIRRCYARQRKRR